MIYRKIPTLKSSNEFVNYTTELGLELLCDHEIESGPSAPLAQQYRLGEYVIGNRFSALPMEGWDGTLDGKPTDLTYRRWENFGRSGAKLIWGGEAVAVRHDGRANPNQLLITEDNLSSLESLRKSLVNTHRDEYGGTDDLLVGLQLTHSGRFSRPNRKDRLEPRILYHHPILDPMFRLPSDYPVMSDDDIKKLIDDFIQAAQWAQQIGFDFVDIKHCHGYLGHEFLSSITRPGQYGGSLENRTRFLHQIVNGIRSKAPKLLVGVRLSAFDFTPFHKRALDNIGEPIPSETPYPFTFGGDGSGVGYDLTETILFIKMIRKMGVSLVCVTGGSPYYNPHIQRPALYPPCDGYNPPEDPLVGVARQISVTATLKANFPDLCIVGSAYTYLQEFLPHVAQAVIRNGQADFVGLGRMLLSYPDLPRDILNSEKLNRRRLCRTLSDCTTAPRLGLISGCYPLDPYYRKRPEAEHLKELKRSI
jgi:2,4-dienoyl-CoA reductase-like NADH-dependent reductase (Old Yellow Enzyme family)